MAHHQARRNLILLIAAAVFAYANNQLIAVTLPVRVFELGQGATAAGVIGGIASVGALAGRFLTLPMLRVFGQRRLLLASAALPIALSPAYALLVALPPLLLLRAVHAFLFAILMTVYMGAVVEEADDAARGPFLALAGLAMPLSLAVFPAAGVALGVERYAQVGLLAGGVAAIAAVLFHHADRQTGPAPAPVGARIGLSWFRDRRVLLGATLALAAASALGLTDGVGIDLIPLYAHNMHVARYGVYFPVYAGSLVLAQLVVARLIRQLPARILATAGLVLMASAFLWLGQAASLPALLGVAGLQASGFAAAQPALGLLVLRPFAHPRQRQEAVAAFFLLFEIGRGAGLAAAGRLIEGWSHAAAATTVTAFCLFTAALIWLPQIAKGPPRVSPE